MSMCPYFEINPETGEFLRSDDGKYLTATKGEFLAGHYYVDEGWTQSFAETLWDFHVMLTKTHRPPSEELVAFLVDNEVPSSFQKFDETVVGVTRLEVSRMWEGVREAYKNDLGREPDRIERYWTVFPEIEKMLIGKEQFYQEKTVEREEWYLADLDLICGCRLNWARLRVFQDGSADAWTSLGLAGFLDEQSASIYIGEDHYCSMDVLRSMPEAVDKVPSKPPTDLNDDAEPFRFFGHW